MSTSIAKNLRKAAAAAIVAGSFLIAALPASADLAGQSGLEATAGAADLPKTQSLPAIVGKIVGSLVGLMGMLFIVLMVYAGFLWMTAQGNEEKIKKAKNLITGTVIGMVITFGAYAITQFVINAIFASTTH